MGGSPESWLLVTVNQPSHCSWWIAAVNLEQSTSYLIAHVQLQKIPNIPNNYGPLDLASTKIQLILSFLNKSLFTIIFFSRLQCQLLFCNQPPSQLQSSNFDLAIVQGVGCTNLGMSNLLDSPPPLATDMTFLDPASRWSDVMNVDVKSLLWFIVGCYKKIISCRAFIWSF